ncbi:MAG: toast rack family protein [Anaerolineales bacterium]|nr:toast rack family protein [Anaerolineales bacterium]
MKNNQLTWGAILILFGGLMLADALGIKLPNGNSLTDIFWSLLLIFGGVWILIGVFYRGKIEIENASIDLQGATSANVRIDHGAGELKIHGGAAGSEFMRGSFMGGLDQKSNRSGDQLEVKMRPAKDAMNFPFLGPRNQLDWDVAFNANIPLALDLNLGANKSTLDLRDMNLTNLDLDTGASESQIYLPARGRFSADIDCGAASVTVHIPEGLAARIRSNVAVGDLNIDKLRFPRNGGYYQSPDFDSAPNAVDMTIDAGAASIKIK